MESVSSLDSNLVCFYPALHTSCLRNEGYFWFGLVFPHPCTEGVRASARDHPRAGSRLGRGGLESWSDRSDRATQSTSPGMRRHLGRGEPGSFYREGLTEPCWRLPPKEEVPTNSKHGLRSFLKQSPGIQNFKDSERFEGFYILRYYYIYVLYITYININIYIFF